MLNYSKFIPLLIFVSFNFLSPFSPAVAINVPHDYETIQDAIDAALDGEVIQVEAGLYTENIDFIGKNITVIGDPNNPDEVVINGSENGSVVHFLNNESPEAVLSGFTIVNGSGYEGQNFIGVGGGIVIVSASPTISHCNIINNSAYGYGGGIFLSEANPIISHCRIEANHLFSQGGLGGGIGLDNSYAFIEECEIFENSAARGGGVYYGGESSGGLLMKCLISHNFALLGGGGIFLKSNSMVDIVQCTVCDNFVDEQVEIPGGGIKMLGGNWVSVANWRVVPL